MSSKSAVAIRHVHFENLGTFAQVLASRGYSIRYLDVGIDDLDLLDPLQPDLLIVLGGPIGVYEAHAYPVLTREIELLTSRLAAGRPTLGVCLGAQLMATALGAKVAATGVKEIGFAELSLTESGRCSVLRHLEGVPVLHWHGDAFEIPQEADHLAATPLCKHQAFAIGRNILGLQFHPEIDASSNIEAWLIGHAAELAGAGIDVAALRRNALEYGPRLRGAARQMLEAWLEDLTC